MQMHGTRLPVWRTRGHCWADRNLPQGDEDEEELAALLALRVNLSGHDSVEGSRTERRKRSPATHPPKPACDAAPPRSEGEWPPGLMVLPLPVTVGP